MKSTLTYAIHDGRLIHVDDADPGGACGCFCPNLACGAPLIAKNRAFHGRIKRTHFAHAADVDCDKASESALHRLAKEIICDERKLRVPERTILNIPANVFESARSQTMQFSVVSAETAIGQFRPDLIAIAGDHQVLVELLVTHQVGEDKRAAAVSNGWSMIEIDLRQFLQNDGFSRTQVRDFLLTSSEHRHWLNHGPMQEVRALLWDAAAPLELVDQCPAGGPFNFNRCTYCECLIRDGSEWRCAGNIPATMVPAASRVALREIEAFSDWSKQGAFVRREKVFDAQMERLDRSREATHQELLRKTQNEAMGAATVFEAMCWQCRIAQRFSRDGPGQPGGICRGCGSWSNPALRAYEFPDPKLKLDQDRIWAVFANLEGIPAWNVARGLLEEEALKYAAHCRGLGWPHVFGIHVSSDLPRHFIADISRW